MKKLVLEFPDSITRGQFIAWYLDAGGEEGLNDYLDQHGLAPMHADSPDSHEEWDWQRLGEDADEHAMVLTPITDDDV